MIEAAALAYWLAREPVITAIAARPRVHYFIKKRKPRPPAPPEATRAAEPIVPAAEPRRVRTIPIVTFDEFYRRVGL